MGLFDKIFGTNDKIRVEFIDNSNGETIGVSEMTADQLPETFSVGTTMHIQDNDWDVEEAIPDSSIDFIKSKSLVLKMRKIEKMNVEDIWYSLPTISNEFPHTIPVTQSTKFDIHIHEDDYRQNEFLNTEASSLIEEEFVGIKNIWEKYSKKSEDYTLFKNCHLRTSIGLPDLTINFSNFKELLKFESVGQVIINGEKLKNGFAVSTDSSTYFGTLENDTIIELCISKSTENTTAEIKKITKAFNLLFVNWNQCEIIKNY
ncbi:hypothetical protein ACFSX9_02740 [Flavobacterium ardleyense]|uniref:Uncharacterized protein n=1 Tax=Flavobacterium ardleyense TaxID=2038737 RepID=A0ABW5Z5C6_9FLAO